MLVEDKNISSLRSAIRRQHMERFNPEILDGIVERRVFFKWLPASYITDLEQGALWWIAASVFATLTPVFPLAALYEYWFKDQDDDSMVVPRPANCAVYVMLIWIGIAYTIGSILFHRAVRHPPVPPLFKWKHICTDELHAMWWFFFGTIPSVPITAIYCYHNGAAGQYGFALALSIIASVVMEIAVFASYPVEDGHPHREWFAPIVHAVFPLETTTIGKYCHNDWLVICWGFLIVSMLANVMAFTILMYFCGRWDIDHSNTGAVGRELYNYGTGLFDTILFTIGCLYMVAGSTFHHSVHNKDDMESGAVDDLDYVNVINLQTSAYEQDQQRVTLRKPNVNEPLSVVLMHGSSEALPAGNVHRNSPPVVTIGDEIIDEIPPPEEDGPAVTQVPNSNRYSMAFSGKEFSL